MKLVGIALTMNSVVEGSAPPAVFASIAEVSSVDGSTFMPEPGWTMLAARSPMNRASVLATSNQIRALSPIRPNALRSPALAMPTTTTQNTSGEMIVLMSRVKPSPRGLRSVATSGHSLPTTIPSTSATATCANSEVRRMRATRRGGDGTGCGTSTPPGGFWDAEKRFRTAPTIEKLFASFATCVSRPCKSSLRATAVP